MSRLRTGTSDLRHLIAFSMVTSAVMAVRPTVSYRALDLGAGTALIGVIGGAYAALSLVTALPVGSRIDRNGERRFFLLGAGMVLGAAVVNSLATRAGVLILTQAVVGMGQMCIALSIQTVTSRGGVRLRDHRFARMAVAGSVGQLAGPLGAGWILGRPDEGAGLNGQSSVFLIAAAMAACAIALSWSARSGNGPNRRPPRAPLRGGASSASLESTA